MDGREACWGGEHCCRRFLTTWRFPLHETTRGDTGSFTESLMQILEFYMAMALAGSGDTLLMFWLSNISFVLGTGKD